MSCYSSQDEEDFVCDDDDSSPNIRSPMVGEDVRAAPNIRSPTVGEDVCAAPNIRLPTVGEDVCAASSSVDEEVRVVDRAPRHARSASPRHLSRSLTDGDIVGRRLFTTPDAAVSRKASSPSATTVKLRCTNGESSIITCFDDSADLHSRHRSVPRLGALTVRTNWDSWHKSIQAIQGAYTANEMLEGIRKAMSTEFIDYLDNETANTLDLSVMLSGIEAILRVPATSEENWAKMRNFRRGKDEPWGPMMSRLKRCLTDVFGSPDSSMAIDQAIKLVPDIQDFMKGPMMEGKTWERFAAYLREYVGDKPYRFPTEGLEAPTGKVGRHTTLFVENDLSHKRPREQDKQGVQCFNCQELGHIKRDCPKHSMNGGRDQVRFGNTEYPRKRYSVPCQICGKMGHKAEVCYSNPRVGGPNRGTGRVIPAVPRPQFSVQSNLNTPTAELASALSQNEEGNLAGFLDVLYKLGNAWKTHQKTGAGVSSESHTQSPTQNQKD